MSIKMQKKCFSFRFVRRMIVPIVLLGHAG